ncbi:unnamed protein product, partial [Choristocarpus tenellus]
IALEPCDDDIRRWKAHLKGPQESPFEGGVYELKIDVGPEYPMVPPSMRFVTKIFHPNIHFDVKSAWTSSRRNGRPPGAFR